MDANDLRPVRRQSHDIRIAHWCPSADLRDAAASKVDAALARVQFLELPDTSDAHVKYKTTVIHDRSQSANLYRRDLIYTATYAITETVSLPAMLFGELNQNALTIYS